MSWTSLVAEYLVVGLVTLAGLMLLFGGPPVDLAGDMFGYVTDEAGLRSGINWPDVPTWLAALVASVILVSSYCLGIAADKVYHRAVERVLKPRTRRLFRHYLGKADRDAVGVRFYGAEDDIYGESGRSQRLSRRRARIRVVRALVFGTFMLIGAALRHDSLNGVLLPAVVVAVVCVAILLDVHKEYVRMVATEARRGAP